MPPDPPSSSGAAWHRADGPTTGGLWDAKYHSNKASLLQPLGRVGKGCPCRASGAWIIPGPGIIGLCQACGSPGVMNLNQDMPWSGEIAAALYAANPTIACFASTRAFALLKHDQSQQVAIGRRRSGAGNPALCRLASLSPGSLGCRAALKSARAIPNPRPEDRRPKETRRPRSELRATPAEQQPVGLGHSRNSDFGLLSGFGLRSSDFRAAEHDLPSTGRTLEQPCLGCDLQPSGLSNNCCSRTPNSEGSRATQEASKSPTSIKSRRWVRSLSRNEVSFMRANALRVTRRNDSVALSIHTHKCRTGED